MRRTLTILALAVMTALSAQAQQVCFWTDEYKALPIRIFVDRQFVGEITVSSNKAPAFGTEGTVSVVMAPGKHKVEAVNVYGYEYDGWPGALRPSAKKVNYVKVKKEDFRRVATVDYLLVGTPYYRHHPGPGPRPEQHGRSHGREDDDLDHRVAADVAVNAAAAFIAMGSASVVNWSYPDDRFPYLAIGAKAEYMPGLEGMRTVARVKGRIGNFGGMSFIADAGTLLKFDETPAVAPTFSAGLGWCYGGFETDFRYKPALGKHSTDTFFALDLSYDFFITTHLAIDFNVGIGMSGYCKLGNHWHGFEVPVGLGVMYCF